MTRAIPHARRTCRELRTPAELAASFRLRYEAYCRTEGMRHFPSLDHAHGLDVDAFDPISRHLGLFEHVAGREVLRGSMRITLAPRDSGAAGERALEALPEMVRSRAARAAPASLPLLSHIPQRDTVAPRILAAARAYPVCEASRFALDPALCAEGPCAATMLVEAALTAFLLCGRADEAYIACVPHHRRLYERYGFRIAQGVGTSRSESLGVDVVLLHARRQSVPLDRQPRLEAMARDFDRSGETAGCQHRFATSAKWHSPDVVDPAVTEAP